MTLELSPDEARALDLGHKWGLISKDRIKRIADQLVEVSTTTPSSEICELSLITQDYRVNEVLAEFFEETQKWPPVVTLLEKYLNLSKLEKGEKYQLYYSISNFADWDDPEPWRTVKIRCHELSDARQKIWGFEESRAEEHSIANEIEKILTSL